MRMPWSLVLAAFLAPALASADVPPPRGYIEKCTAERQCRKGEEADVCSAYHGDPNKCHKKHKSDGFQFRCKTSGASVWTEVWCRPKSATTAPKAPDAAPRQPAQPAK